MEPHFDRVRTNRKGQSGLVGIQLLDIAEQIDGEGAQFVMSDAGSPTIVRDSADKSALYVLMPMRV